MLYFLAMLPLGVTYFTVAVTLLAVGAAFIAWPFAWWFGNPGYINVDLGWFDPSSPWVWPLSIVAGVLLILAMLHLARLVGHLHGKLAKSMLVSSRAE